MTDEQKKYVLAKSDDGGVQITFTIANTLISSTKNEVVEKLGKDVEVPGFRKGKAPKEKILASISKEKLANEVLARILPKMLGEAIKSENLKLAIYPKFELLKAEDNQDWQVRGVSAEVPEFELGNYKQKVKSSHPKMGKQKAKGKSAAKQEKESRVLEALLKNIKIKIPHMLIEEEINRRLSQLLERIEKLGLNLDAYLTSIGKTPAQIREEYGAQAHSAISLELILSKVSEKEKIDVDEKKIDETIKASTPEKDAKGALDNKEQRSIVRSVLKRRAVIDFLTSL